MRFDEEDIRPEALMADKQSCIDHDRKYLLERRHQWVDVPCPACGADHPLLFGEKHGFTYVECSDCGTVYTNPRPSESLSHAFYTQSMNYAYWNRHIFPATEDARRARIFAPRAVRLQQYCQSLSVSSGTLMDVGSAFGTFCEEVRSLGIFKRIIAVEPTPDLAATCRRRGFETLEQPIESLPDVGTIDVLTAFEVLEHLFSPLTFVTTCRRLIRAGGLLVVTCPNVEGFDMSTLGVLSNSFDHEHVNYFHTKSLPLLLARCGFTVEQVATPGQLDVDLVHKQAQDGTVDLSEQPFLRAVLLERWEELSGPFQEFLAEHCLSSHMWVVARRKSDAC